MKFILISLLFILAACTESKKPQASDLDPVKFDYEGSCTDERYEAAKNQSNVYGIYRVYPSKFLNTTVFSEGVFESKMSEYGNCKYFKMRAKISDLEKAVFKGIR